VTRAARATRGLLALGALILYGIYVGSGVWAWRHEGRKYHIIAMCIAAVSGVRARWAAARVVAGRAWPAAAGAGARRAASRDRTAARRGATPLWARARSQPLRAAERRWALARRCPRWLLAPAWLSRSRAPAAAARPAQLWCFGQVAHTLCCPGFMLSAAHNAESASPPRVSGSNAGAAAGAGGAAGAGSVVQSLPLDV
jgi:hypothetical protein